MLALPRLRRLLFSLVLCSLLLPLAGCDVLAELLEIPNPAREAARRKAEGAAVGGACRHAGRSLEDCFALNPDADKAAVFGGWREMNDYMMAHKLHEVPSQFVPGLPAARITPSRQMIIAPENNAVGH